MAFISGLGFIVILYCDGDDDDDDDHDDDRV